MTTLYICALFDLLWFSSLLCQVNFDRSILQGMMQLRADYKTAKIGKQFSAWHKFNSYVVLSVYCIISCSLIASFFIDLRGKFVWEILNYYTGGNFIWWTHWASFSLTHDVFWVVFSMSFYNGDWDNTPVPRSCHFCHRFLFSLTWLNYTFTILGNYWVNYRDSN